jgi:hypothetical protein
VEIILYFLIFVFGYVTCKTFYFLRSMRTSLRLLRASHLIYLSTIIKAIENLSYSREIMLEHMLKTGKDSTQISSFELRFDEDVKRLQERSIRELDAQHPKFFKNMIEFDDWKSSMQYLMDSKDEVLKFWS